MFLGANLVIKVILTVRHVAVVLAWQAANGCR